MPNFLFELLVEDMPHGVLPGTSEYIEEQVPHLLEKHGIYTGNIEYFTTPRRLAFLVRGIPEKGLDRIIEQKGPSVKAAYDQDGNPSKALEGFFKSYGVTADDIEQREIKGQKYIFVQKTESGDSAELILPRLIKELIDGIKFHQPMRWNEGGEVFEFIRPVRGILALLDGSVLPLNMFGLDSHAELYGHRQMYPKPVTLANPLDYEKTLKQHGVVPSFSERQSIIFEQAEKCAASAGGNAVLDDELLSILASLTENPNLLLADFDPSYLKLPKEVLISEMKVHQKYIPVTKSGKLLPNYIITANIPVSDSETRKNILAGNNRVLLARFADGQFFFDEDSKKGLDHYANQLKSVSFVEGAGSIADKINRMQKLAVYLKDVLAPQISTEDILQAVYLSKADLSSLMVGEFPELQGIIGYYYAKNEDIPHDIALSIREHYHPDEITQDISSIVALADRIDNLFTLYAVGRTVTGSRDPYGLRRQTIAVLNILLKNEWEQFSMRHLIENNISIYAPLMTDDQKKWNNQILDFVKTRLEGILKSEPYNYNADTLNAAFHKDIDQIVSDASRASALQKVRQQPSFPRLVELYKRISNILKDQHIQPLREELLEEPAEKNLYNYCNNLKFDLVQYNEEEYLEALLKMEEPIAEFFDNVMVKTGDQREINRTALLNMVQQIFLQQADFSKIS